MTLLTDLEEKLNDGIADGGFSISFPTPMKPMAAIIPGEADAREQEKQQPLKFHPATFRLQKGATLTILFQDILAI